jgi:RNA polymerase sigma-70 factor (ECF subfamily)
LETIVADIPANKLVRICAYSAKAPEWEQFVRAVTPAVLLSARRVGEIWGDSSSATVHEILQEVFVKLCEDDRRVLREFEDRGLESFFKLIRLVTTSVGTDHFRRARAEKRGGRSNSVEIEPTGWQTDILDRKATRSVELPSLIAQLDGLLLLHPEKVSRRDRSLFWLHYSQGMPAEAISKIPAIGLSAKGVESALLRMTRLLRHTIRNGKPKQRFTAPNLHLIAKEKGFSTVIPINNVKR